MLRWPMPDQREKERAARRDIDSKKRGKKGRDAV